MLTLTTSSQATEVMLNFYSRIFCISKFPKEVPLESKEFQSYKAKKKKKMTWEPLFKYAPSPRQPTEKEATFQGHKSRTHHRTR